jgi:hypothetical protein
LQIQQIPKNKQKDYDKEGLKTLMKAKVGMFQFEIHHKTHKTWSHKKIKQKNHQEYCRP